LMPGVVQGFVGGEPAFDFLVDRHFWVTAFMYGFPHISSCEGLC
jgi:hypothetical protein